jgi:hypothetical protein
MFSGIVFLLPGQPRRSYICFRHKYQVCDRRCVAGHPSAELEDKFILKGGGVSQAGPRRTHLP